MVFSLPWLPQQGQAQISASTNSSRLAAALQGHVAAVSSPSSMLFQLPVGVRQQVPQPCQPELSHVSSKKAGVGMLGRSGARC